VACAAALATLDLMEQDAALQRVRELAPRFERAVHGLQGVRHVADVRNYGLAAGISVDPLPGEPAKRPYEIAMAMLRKGFYVRYGGDTIQLAPPFTSSVQEIGSLLDALAQAFHDTP
jgi:beta-alanine--pyruvate transaminase